MTRPGTVAEQPTLPSTASIARLRDPGAQKDAAAAGVDGAEGEFVALLSKLKQGGGQDVDEASLPNASSAPPELRQVQRRAIDTQIRRDGGDSDASSAPTELRQVRRRAVDAQIGRDGGDSHTNLPTTVDSLPPSDPDPVADPLPNAQTEEQPEAKSESLDSDASPIQPNELTASTVNDIAAIIMLPVVKPAAGSKSGQETDANVQAPKSSPVADPRAAARAILESSLGGAEAAPALPTARTAKIQPHPNDQRPAGADATDPDFAPDPAPDLAPDPAPAKEPGAAMPARSELLADARVPKASVVRSESLKEPGAAMPARSELPADARVPKASVVRSESHFAPVAPPPTLSHPDVSARDSGKHGAGADAKGHQAAAPSLDAPMPPPEEPVSVSLSPTQQIADRIATESAAFENADRVGAPPDQPSQKPVLKVLQIQLQPTDLGTVTVRMELKESGLKLHVEVDRTETADIIRGDQDTLSKLLRSAGYGIDPGSIRIVEGDRTVTPSQAGQQGAQTNLQSSTQSQSGWSERQDRPQRGYTGTNGGEAQIPTNRNDMHETTTNRTGRDLYI